MSRQLQHIDRKQFESLCAFQCTRQEVCQFFSVTSDDLEEWCRATYDQDFDEVFEQKRQPGLISLRRAQFKLAEKSAPMAMFLGKQYLGQDSKVAVELSAEEVDDGDDAFLAAIITGAARPTR